jgi:hypothetical protein
MAMGMHSLMSSKYLKFASQNFSVRVPGAKMRSQEQHHEIRPVKSGSVHCRRQSTNCNTLAAVTLPHWEQESAAGSVESEQRSFKPNGKHSGCRKRSLSEYARNKGEYGPVFL